MEGAYGNATNAAMAGEVKNVQHFLILVLCLLLLSFMQSLQTNYYCTFFFSGPVLHIH